jgi:hypothetical protein
MRRLSAFVYAFADATMMSVCEPRPVKTRPSPLRTRMVTSPWASMPLVTDYSMSSFGTSMMRLMAM